MENRYFFHPIGCRISINKNVPRTVTMSIPKANTTLSTKLERNGLVRQQLESNFAKSRSKQVQTGTFYTSEVNVIYI